DCAGAEALQRRRQAVVGREDRTLRRLWQRGRQAAHARKRIEQDWRGRSASDKSRYRRAIRAADPDADRALAVEADRPCVAIAVARAGLERDAPADGVFRR